MSRVVYRVVKTSPPTAEDFLSNIAKGWKRPTDPRKLHELLGVSVQGDLKGARSLQRSFPALGDYISELTIPDDAPLLFEPEGTGPGHYNTYDSDGNEVKPSTLLDYVTDTFEARSHRRS